MTSRLFFTVVFLFVAQSIVVSVAAAQNGKYDSLLAAIPKEKADSVYALVTKGEEYQSRGEYDSAISANFDITKILPNFPPAFTTMAGLYGVKQDYRSEIVWADKAIAADSSYLNAYINLGNAYASLRSYDTATTIYMVASLVDPRSAVPMYSLGVLQGEQGQADAALRNYLQAIRIDSTFEAAYFNAGMIYANQKKFTQAKKMLMDALKFDPYDYDAGRAIKDIEKDENEADSKKK
ncbi:MAG TPA: tetratricopeptide repeat protein [Candidatus Kapabacteria bacterium]|nr:tetratricopeptide repeat protein [Candidatus Kapabacteria bacterium]